MCVILIRFHLIISKVYSTYPLSMTIGNKYLQAVSSFELMPLLASVVRIERSKQKTFPWIEIDWVHYASLFFHKLELLSSMIIIICVFSLVRNARDSMFSFNKGIGVKMTWFVWHRESVPQVLDRCHDECIPKVGSLVHDDYSQKSKMHNWGLGLRALGLICTDRLTLAVLLVCADLVLAAPAY